MQTMKMAAVKLKDKNLIETMDQIVKIREGIQIKAIQKYLSCCDRTNIIAFYQWREMFSHDSDLQSLEILKNS